LGSWLSLSRLAGTDRFDNTIIGRHLGMNTKGTIVRTSDNHLVVTVGLKDCLVVHTPEATLVANKNDEESIREIVKMLEARGWSEYL
jgi:mannose-1-phosphate guanylyltransferase